MDLIAAPKKAMQQNEQIINSILTNEAMHRYKRIKTYHPEKSRKIDGILMEMYYNRKIHKMIDEDEFVEIIGCIKDDDNKMEIKIERRKRDWDLDDL